jgi:glycosyltransferase involved in cell wall biosynthesis
MLNSKIVAVVVPTYNEEKQIRQVLETMPDFVDCIIVVNDCSTDNTAVILLKIIPTNNTLYLFPYFPMNCFCNFFLSSAISFSSFTSATGRKSQIRSFTRTISSQSFVNCR